MAVSCRSLRRFAIIPDDKRNNYDEDEIYMEDVAVDLADVVYYWPSPRLVLVASAANSNQQPLAADLSVGYHRKRTC